MELRQISDEELEQILKDHVQWLESEGKDKEKGKRAYLGATDLKNRNLLVRNLTKACLNNAHLEGANLDGAHLEGADLIVAHLEGTCLIDAHLEGAYLNGAHLEGANLNGAHLNGADLQSANLNGAYLSQVEYNDKDDPLKAIRQAVRYKEAEMREIAEMDFEEIRLDERVKGPTIYRGISVDGAIGNPSFVRFAKDQSWLEDYLAPTVCSWKEAWKTGMVRRKIWAFFWRHTSNYGRSFWRWALVALAIAVIFGGLFYTLDFYAPGGAFAIPHLPDPQNSPIGGLFTMIYYSVVTFTTLGFGDVVPQTLPAAILVTAEVILGYLMLGGLISIFSNVLARRA